jgi:hypothetical protein
MIRVTTEWQEWQQNDDKSDNRMTRVTTEWWQEWQQNDDKSDNRMMTRVTTEWWQAWQQNDDKSDNRMTRVTTEWWQEWQQNDDKSNNKRQEKKQIELLRIYVSFLGPWYATILDTSCNVHDAPWPEITALGVTSALPFTYKRRGRSRLIILNSYMAFGLNSTWLMPASASTG